MHPREAVPQTDEVPLCAPRGTGGAGVMCPGYERFGARRPSASPVFPSGWTEHDDDGVRRVRDRE